MRNLLCAGVAGLRKNKTFWLGILAMFALGIFCAYSKYSDIVRYDQISRLDDVLFSYIPLTGLCSAVFCSMFVGTEYSDGTLRNKLIVGHTRESIYCSNLLLCIGASLLMAFAWLFSYASLGHFLLFPPEASAKTILFYALISAFTITAYASLFCMLSMLIPKKAAAAVTCLLVFGGLLIIGMTIAARLDAPEFHQGYIMGANGLEQAPPTPNPKYLQPDERKVWQFFFDFVPAGQSMQLITFSVLHPLALMLYSMLIDVAAAAVGLIVFRRQNLK